VIGSCEIASRSAIGHHQTINKALQKGAAEQDHKIGCVKGKDERCRVIELVGGNQQLNTEDQIKPGDGNQNDLSNPPVSADPGMFVLLFIFLMGTSSITI